MEGPAAGAGEGQELSMNPTTCTICENQNCITIPCLFFPARPRIYTLRLAIGAAVTAALTVTYTSIRLVPKPMPADEEAWASS